MKKPNRFILTKEQIDVVRTMHNQLIMDGLAEVGLTRQVENDILENADHNFDLMMKQAQKVLTEMGVMEQIREEIMLEEKQELAATNEPTKKTTRTPKYTRPFKDKTKTKK
jgi:hypothetical protein